MLPLDNVTRYHRRMSDPVDQDEVDFDDANSAVPSSAPVDENNTENGGE